MLSAGKATDDAWLQMPLEHLMSWAALNGIEFHGIKVSADPASAASTKGQSSADAVLDSRARAIKGSGLVASTELDSSQNDIILSVPLDMVLSENRVRELASGDAKLAELLKVCETFAITSRITILIFLLHQASVANPQIASRFGQHTPFIEYGNRDILSDTLLTAGRFFKFLSLPRVSTMFTEDEISLFEGTTLVPATMAKLRKLNREFELLRTCTQSIQWLAPVWWNAEEDTEPMITIQDWILLDTIYRSRALEWPGQGEAMVPALDMVNHTVPANASFLVGPDGQGILKLESSIKLQPDDEVFISYGDHKTPLEMFFSYGFLPSYADEAGSILVPLPPMDDNDPLAPPKAAMAGKESVVPGIRIYEDADTISWDSELLWLTIVNEEDGLGFKVKYGPDGQRELDMFWHDERVTVVNFKNVLEQDALYDLFRLRASVIVLQQIGHQLLELEETSLDFEATAAAESDILLVEAARKLRSMEEQLLLSARFTIEQEKDTLVSSPAVQAFFANVRQRGELAADEPDGGDGDDHNVEVAEDDFT